MSVVNSGRLVRVGDRLVHVGPHPVPRHPARPVFLWARLRGPALDHRLARGEAPWTSPVLTARSLLITSPTARRSLAVTLDELVQRAADSGLSSLATAVVPVDRRAVLAHRDVLTDLACRLRSDAPVATGAVAALGELLRDGAGPVYSPLGGHLGHALAAIVDSLDVS